MNLIFDTGSLLLFELAVKNEMSYLDLVGFIYQNRALDEFQEVIETYHLENVVNSYRTYILENREELIPN